MELFHHIQQTHQNETSLKELLLWVRSWVKYLKKRWLVILTVTLVGIAGGVTRSFIQPPLYIGRLTFVLDEGGGDPLQNYLALSGASAFTINRISASSVFTTDNMLEFLKSRLVVERVLLSPVMVNGRTQSLADIYIKESLSKQAWTKGEINTYVIPADKARKDFTIQQDSLLEGIYSEIVTKNLVVTKINKKVSLISVKCFSYSETFSRVFTERILEEAAKFYAEIQTKQLAATVTKLENKADSIQQLLTGQAREEAIIKDANLNQARKVADVRRELLVKDKQALQTVYINVVEQLEGSRVALQERLPIIQVIDKPGFPMKKVRLGLINGVILGGFIGFSGIIVFFLSKRTLKFLI